METTNNLEVKPKERAAQIPVNTIVSCDAHPLRNLNGTFPYFLQNESTGKTFNCRCIYEPQR